MLRLTLQIVGALLMLLLVVVAVAVASSRASLDWERTHREATRALPLFTGFGSASEVRIPAGGMELRARIAGTSGEGAILLHGFPTTSAMYTRLLGTASDAGYRAVAFDQRGYSPDARPDGVESYVTTELAQDVLRVADAVGFERFHLVGHDWGAVVGWNVALLAPERVLSWTALSIPHPSAFGEALATDPDQQRRSSYFLVFRTPWLPETLFTLNRLWLLRSSVYATTPEDEREEYLRVFAEPGALTSALAWYRAIDRSIGAAPDTSPQVRVPTLFIWGNRDDAVGRAAVEGQRKYIEGKYREIELDAAHWLMEENGPRIIAETLSHWDEQRSEVPAAP